MVTRIAKGLVFVNLVLAVALFAWAVSLYSNRPDWFDRTDGDLKVEGTVTRLKNEVERLNKGVKDAQANYAQAEAQQRRVEATRDGRRAVLARWLNDVKDTNNAKAEFKVIPRLAGGLIDTTFDQGGRPLPSFGGLQGRPLPGLGRLATDLRNLLREEKDTKAQIVAARTKLNEVADQIDVAAKEVLAQKAIRGNLEDQQAFLADAQINWEETLRTLQLRERQLTARMDELKVGGGNGN